MKQVVVIHGGNSFKTYEEYLEYLKTDPLEDPRQKSKGWKALLGEKLGPGYEVIAPRMPNSQNAKYDEWKIWFERHIQFMSDEVILVGHSLGGVFLAKYLSEARFPKKILATLIVAAPYSLDEGRTLVEFNIENSLELLEEQGGKIFLYHSTDDPVVSFGELAKFRTALPSATVREFNDRGHFFGDDFPEIVSDILSL